MANPRPLGWGFIGASNISHTRILNAIRAQSNNEVVAVMSTNLERAQRFAAETGISRAYDSLDTILADPKVDVVYISTTNELHYEQTIAAAKAGKHVLCEKPLAMNLGHARQMIEVCQASGVILATNHHLRNAATHRTLRRLIAAGTIGQPLAVRIFHAVYLPPHLQGWRITKPEAGGGVVLDITVHDADTLRFVMDDEVETVTALTAQQGLAGGKLEDAVMGVMRLRSGVLAQFHDAFTVRYARTGFEVHGAEGSLIGQDVMTQNPIGRILLRQGGGTAEETEIFMGESENLYTRSIRLFVEAVFGQGEPAASGEDGLRSLAIALAVAESARTGTKINVRYD